MSLPPLPEPDDYKNVLFFDTIEGVYYKKTMEDYGRACREAALEEAAKVCDTEDEISKSGWTKRCAAAIRALKDQKQE